MKRPLAACALVACACSSTPDPAPAPDAAVDAASPPDASPPSPPVAARAPFRAYVDPLVGTGGDGFGTGSAFPGPQRPFGLARPGPDTTDARGDAIGYAHCAGYAHFDTHISGFSQIHMHGTGIVDEGALGFMPTVGMSAAKTRQRGRLAPFRHARETATPGYYRVTFDGSEVTTEVTATERVALYRVRFPRGADGHLLFDVGHALPDVRVTRGALELDPAAGELRGTVHFEGQYSDRFGGVDLHWVARASRPLTGAGTWRDGVMEPAARQQTGSNIGAWVPVDTRTDDTVTVAIGLSFTDVAHARANLAAEAADLDFDRVRRESEAAWEAMLARVEVTAPEATVRRVYTAVYHTLLMPTLVSDHDGTYRGVDRAVRRAEGWSYYSNFSLWDTWRTEHPWLAVVYPERLRDLSRSLLAMADALGYYPRWPLETGETGGMIGDPGALVMADAWLRGVRDWDVPRAWTVARRGALTPMQPTRREHGDEYRTRGWVPADTGGSSASKTLEYACADAALARWARGLGHADDAAALDRMSTSYRNLWDPAQRFLVGRRRSGEFVALRGETPWQEVYAEGNAWQYVWFAPHDLEGLAVLMGGRAPFLARLDGFFAMSMAARRTPLPDPYYWHGNEPDIHAPWIPSAFDDAAAASRYVEWVRRTRYSMGPDGIPGNDDAGTLSAWYLFSALGVFPLAGTDTWLLAAPAVTAARVRLADGATLRVEAPGVADGALVPSRIRLDDTALPRPRLTQAQLARGGTLRFDLTR